MDTQTDHEAWETLVSATFFYSRPEDQYDFSQQSAAHNHIEGRKYTAEDWHSMRSEITELYWEEDKTLEVVMELMTKRHGVVATAKQYKDHFKKWNINKNIQPREMKAMIRMQRRREAESNKSSAFRVRKRPVNPIKITRYIKEHLDDLHFEDSASARTPDAVSCYTPSPPTPSTSILPFARTCIAAHLFQDLLATLENFLASGGPITSSPDWGFT